MPQFTLIYRLSVQKGPLYKMLNSEIVYLACLRPNTLKIKPCSAAHPSWSQTREYPTAKFMAAPFLCHVLSFLSKHFSNPSPHLLWYTWCMGPKHTGGGGGRGVGVGASSCRVGEDPGRTLPDWPKQRFYSLLFYSGFIPHIKGANT